MEHCPSCCGAPRVQAVFDDIRATRNSDFVNPLWHHLAFDALRG